MDPSDLVSALQRLAFSADFSPETLAKLAKHAWLRSLRTGEVLFREGETNDDFFIVKSGRITLEMCVPARGCMHLLTLGEGEVVAWSALVGGGKMTAMASARQPTELIVIPGRQLLEQCEADHTLGYQLMRRLAISLSRRLVATRLQLLDLYAQELPQRNGSRT